MSGQKKEIHVRDLVIKADNVYFEQERKNDAVSERQHRPFWAIRPRRHEEDNVDEQRPRQHPIFGPFPGRRVRQENESESLNHDYDQREDEHIEMESIDKE